MDKIKEIISSAFGKAVGTTLAGFVARVVIALLALYTGSATDVGDAVGQALDKERSIAAAVELINETPKSEIIQAVNEQKPE